MPEPTTTTPAKPVVKVSNSVLETYHKALKQKVIADVSVATAKTVAATSLEYLKKTKITKYKITNNVLYVYVDNNANDPFPSDSTSLNAHHWVLGLGSGIDTISDENVTSDGTNWWKFNRTHADVALKQDVKGAYIYSVSGRGSILSMSRGDWDRIFAKNLSKVKVANFNTSFLADSNDMPSGLPLHYTSLFGPVGGDDVEWASWLKSYYHTCQIDATKKTTAFNSAFAALKTEQKSLHLTVAKNPFVTPKVTTTTTGGGGGGGGGKNDTPDPNASNGRSGIGDDTKPVIYNLPACKDMYFASNDGMVFVTAGNKPSYVKEAQALWTENKAYKGMIQSYIVPGAFGKSKANWWKPQDSKYNIRSINKRRYGFQFMYNPSTLSMHYAGAPQVDIGLEISGADKVPLIGAGVTSSSITFDLILNRMNDMKYIDSLLNRHTGTSTGQYLLGADGVQRFIPGKYVDGPEFNDVYSHHANHPETHDHQDEIESVWEELGRIKEMGTMYDIEYLLRSLIGYQLRSTMRDVLTADVGYLGAYPVELHLGKSLRYLVTIDSFDISHTIFTKDMVPVFTNLRVTCNRLPDFAAGHGYRDLTKTTDTSKDASK